MASKIISLLKSFQRLLVGPQHGTKFSFTPNHLAHKPANFKKALLSPQLSSKISHINFIKKQVFDKFPNINVVKIASSKASSDNKYPSWKNSNNRSPFLQQFYTLYQLDKVLYKERSLFSPLTSQFTSFYQAPFRNLSQFCAIIFKKNMSLLVAPPPYVSKSSNQTLEKSSNIKLYRIREAIFPNEKAMSPSNYYLSAPLDILVLHHLAAVLSHDLFTGGSEPTYLKIVPTSEFKGAFSNLIVRLEKLNCGLKDISILLLRLLEFGPWQASVTNSEFRVWLPSTFNFYSFRQFIRDIGMESLLKRLTLGNVPFASCSKRVMQKQVAERCIAPQKFTPQKVPTASYRQELFDFNNLMETARGGLGTERS